MFGGKQLVFGAGHRQRLLDMCVCVRARAIVNTF
jgi:hypothetical protein